MKPRTRFLPPPHPIPHQLSFLGTLSTLTPLVLSSISSRNFLLTLIISSVWGIGKVKYLFNKNYRNDLRKVKVMHNLE